MVDLETADTLPTAALFSIGAVLFDSGGIVARFHIAVDLQSCIDAGLTVGGSTIYWWLEQSDAAVQGILADADGRCPLAYALQKFREFIPSDACVWGNGSEFDNAALINAYAAIGPPLPWERWENRCYRTAASLAPNIDREDYRVGTFHNAQDDAEAQALHLIEIARAFPELLA